MRSPLCVAEVATTQGRHQQAAVLVAKLDHPGVHRGDRLNWEDDKRALHTNEQSPTHSTASSRPGVQGATLPTLEDPARRNDTFPPESPAKTRRVLVSQQRLVTA